MAIGAISRATGVAEERGEQTLKAARLSFAGDSSYPTGGTAGFKALVEAGLTRKIVDLVCVVPDDCGDNLPLYDRTSDKLKVRVISTAAEVGNGVNLSGTTFNLTVLFR